MVSGFKTSPKERFNISSGESSPTEMVLKACESLEDAGLLVNNNERT